MILPLSESLAVAYDWAPSKLQTPVLKQGLGRLAKLLQGGVTSYYFEWNLQQANVFDLLLLIPRSESSDFLARLSREHVLLKKPGWNAVIRFMTAWNSGRSALAAAIPHIWLAFDFSKTHNTFSPPNAHFCLDRNFTRRNQIPSHINRLSKKQFRSVIAYASHDFISPQTHSFLDHAERCFSLLPDQGEVLHFSIMHARDPWTAKCNMTLPKPALIPFLKRIGWQGDLSRAGAVLDDFCPDEKRITFNILMNNSLLNSLELEFDFNSPLMSDPRRERVLDLLRRRGCASKSDCRAVTRWPGYDWQPVTNGIWPAKIKKWLNLKLCIDEKESLTAKAYLGFHPFFSII
jgi:hypothetical protein